MHCRSCLGCYSCCFHRPCAYRKLYNKADLDKYVARNYSGVYPCLELDHPEVQQNKSAFLYSDDECPDQTSLFGPLPVLRRHRLPLPDSSSSYNNDYTGLLKGIFLGTLIGLTLFIIILAAHVAIKRKTSWSLMGWLTRWLPAPGPYPNDHGHDNENQLLHPNEQVEWTIVADAA